MKYAVVTSFSPNGYDVYGRQMIETFAENWPADVSLYVYYEGDKPRGASDRAIWISLDADKDRAAFMAKFKDGTDRSDKKRWDYTKGIVTYSHKVFAMTSAPQTSEVLIWLDGDTDTVVPITSVWLDKLLPDGYVCSYLGRPYRHTETGFLAFDLTQKWGANFLCDLRRVYTSGDIAKLYAQHDCAAFDFMREKYEEAGQKFYNLCPGAVGLDVFSQSPLCGYIDHNKGPIGKFRAYGAIE